MRFYYVTDGRTTSRYFGTLAEAHARAKDSYDRFDVTIQLVEIDTDRENLLALLNGDGGYESPVFRTWVLAPRGGLREATPDDSQ